MIRKALCFLLLTSPLFGASVTITSPTAGQTLTSVSAFPFTATVASAPTGYSLEWDIDSERWAVGYAKKPYPGSNDYRDAWFGPWTVNYYPGWNGDGLHYLTATLRDAFGVLLASTSVNFNTFTIGMGNQSMSPAMPTSGNQSNVGGLSWDGHGMGLAVDGVPIDSNGLLITDNNNNVYSSGWINTSPNVWQVFTSTNPTSVFFNINTAGTKVGSIGAVTAFEDWFWGANELYVFSTTQPGTTCHSNPANTSQTGGHIFRDFDTTCWPNGQHQAVLNWFPSAVDPYVKFMVVGSTAIASNNITVPSHFFANNTPIVFQTTATLPSPLVAGTQWFWGTSTTNSNTATLTIAGGTMTVVCSASCGETAGSMINFMNIQSTAKNGLPNCDGLFPVASVWTTSFTVIAPATCPNGAASSLNLEIDINPYFAQYVDSNTISVSATPGGSTVVLSTTPMMGLTTIETRMKSSYYTSSGNNGAPTPNVDYMAVGGWGLLIQTVTFANGTTPMELRPPYWEVHGVVGGSKVSVCPTIENTDLTSTALTCNGTGVGYQEVDDGGQSGVCSVDASGNISFLSPGWCKVNVTCSGCTAKTTSLPQVTVYVQSHSGSITFPHFTHAGPIATSYTPGSSFIPISMWQLDIGDLNATDHNVRPTWFGPTMQSSNLNSALNNLGSGVGPGTSPQSSCPVWTSTTTEEGKEEAFANLWNIYFEHDLSDVWFLNNNSNSVTALSAILNNQQYDRQTCVKNLVAHHIATGRYWRYFNDDEFSNILGAYLMPNTLIGGKNWTSAVVNAGTITFNVQNISAQTQWNQTTGNGYWVRVASATNSCLNGWYPLNGVFSSSWTSITTCANGTYAPSGGTITESSAAIVTSPEVLAQGQNISSLPNNLPYDQQAWNAVYTDGTFGAVSTAMSSMTCTSGTCSIHYVANAIPAGNAIRISGATTANLNIVSTITVVSADTFTITYSNMTGELQPADGIYTIATDPNLRLTVDPNWGTNPLFQFYALVRSVANHPAISWSMLGNLFSVGNSTGLYSYMGDPNNTDAASDYVPTVPTNVYADDAGVWGYMTYTQASSGLTTRAYQTQPRSGLPGLGVYSTKFSQNFQEFNPNTDKPSQLQRPESLIPETMAMLALNMDAFRYYNFTGNMGVIYSNTCCGWSAGGTGTGNGSNPFINPKLWASMVHTNALLKMLEPNVLQPFANKPYLGPMFITDAHTSAMYGNELMVVCGDNVAYGTQTVTLPQISGGTTLKYILNGYSLTTSVLPGNPSTDTEEFCKTPGQTTVFISQPPGFNQMDSVNFSPPASLPYGSSKYLIQVGYYSGAMQDDPITDCTSGCTIPIQHYHVDAYYRIIYADSNSLPLTVGDPQKLAGVNQ